MSDHDAMTELRLELQEARTSILMLSNQLKETQVQLEQSQRDVQALRRLITRLLERMI